MKVLVECNADEVVLRAIGVPRKQLLHFGGKYELVKKLKERPHDVGVVDEDPGKNQPKDMDSYRQTDSAQGLRLLTRQGRDAQRLVVVCPRLEDWLIDRAKSSGIHPQTYGLPGDADRLHGIPRYEQKEGFRSFLEELKKENREMHVLRRWIFEEQA